MRLRALLVASRRIGIENGNKLLGVGKLCGDVQGAIARLVYGIHVKLGPKERAHDRTRVGSCVQQTP